MEKRAFRWAILGAGALGLALQTGCVTIVREAAPCAGVPEAAPAAAALAPAETTPAEPATEDPTAPYVIVHRVEGGDSLWTLARRYGVSVAELAESNGITDPGHIRIGQEIRIRIEPEPKAAISAAATGEW